MQITLELHRPVFSQTDAVLFLCEVEQPADNVEDSQIKVNL